jgi:DNA topoisomerase-1
MLDKSQTPEVDADDDTVSETREIAEEAGLIYVSDEEPGIRRKAEGGEFAYFNSKGQPIRNEDTLRRVRSLAVPPAYTDVWICPKANGHIQATGRDARGRKQYRYHPRWNEARDQTKYEHVLRFAATLPGLRARVGEDMAKRGLPREKVLATIVSLLETTLIRVGNEDYARENKSYGLTTLRNAHVAIDGGELRFRFKGKSGKSWNLKLRDRRVAKIVRACQELPGQHLFEYLDEQKIPRSVTSADINAYLREASGEDITAKDFRTWHGTVLAAMALSEFAAFDTKALAKKNVRAAIERVAARLGNTTTICRKCYIHPEVLTSYLDGRLLEEIEVEVEAELRDDLAKLRPEEAAVLALLNKRLRSEIQSPKAKRKRPTPAQIAGA